ncbi:MAG TPA: hypothetical protein VL242_14805 [Sorangium sp.]|nr:hypothetical protein [Sorangium sp.]
MQIFKDTVIESGRSNRPQLRAWARASIQKLSRIDQTLERPNTTSQGWIDIARVMNNAALIDVYRGSHRSARELCELQLRWIERLICSHGPAACGDLAIQPWVNLGRLLRIRGEHERALQHFALLPDTLAGRSIRLGPIDLDTSTWLQLVEANSLWGFLNAVYIIDSTKTHLASGAFAEAVRFLRHVRTLVRDTPSVLLDEAELIALASMKRYEEAIAVTEGIGWQQDSYVKLVRVTYRVALLAALGSTEAARRLVAQLSERVLRGDLGAPRDQRVVRYLEQLGRVTAHLGLRELTERILRLGLRAARHVVDVPLELSFLESLLKLDGIAEREALAVEREALLGDCLYVTLLEPRGRTVDPLAAADPIFDELRRLLERAASTSSCGAATEV